MKKALSLVAIASLMFSCSEKTPVPETEKTPINISVGLQTRANDSAFETEDEIGLYVVNYDGTTVGTLKLEGNQADNAQFTFDGSKWDSTEDIYWKDQNTSADFYAYYPYSATIASIEEHPFSIQTDQSVEDNFWASDFLWGKSAKVSPTPLAVPIKTNHIFSRAVIDIKPGNGFTEDAWNTAVKSVCISEVKTSATIDLSTGVATATGNVGAITPLTISTTGSTITYKAMMIPQDIADNSKLIVVTVDGTDYVYRKGFTFKANTEHSFSITVNKTEGGVDMSIGEWTIDDTTNEGDAFEENEEEITNCQILYTSTEKIESEMSNPFDSTIKSNTWDSETGQGVITFEDNITKVGSYAFKNCTSLTSITIPNGVTTIGVGAFYACSNLKSISLPESITSIGYEGFYHCESLKSFDIPQNITTIEKSVFWGCSSLESINLEGIISIGYEAFSNCNSLTSVLIPESVTSIGGSAFEYCKNLSYINCTNPTPQQIGGRAFDNNASDRKILVPATSVDLYKEATGWKEYADYIYAASL